MYINLLTLSSFRNLAFIILFLSLGQALFGQQITESDLITALPDTIRVDSTVIDKIPPLQCLIDSAIKYSDLIHRQDKMYEIKSMKTNAVALEWLKYINLFATSNYGVYDNFMSVQDQSVVGSTLNTGTSFRWSVGVTVSGTPIYDIFNKPTMKKIQGLEADQELDLKKDLEVQIKRLVIEQYNQTLLSYYVMIIANQNIYSNYTQLVLSEQKFYNGEMEIFALANVREMYFKSLMTFETNKYEFQKNYKILETICGFQF